MIWRTYSAEAEKKAAAPTAAPHIGALVDQISKLNILEVSELVKALQVGPHHLHFI